MTPLRLRTEPTTDRLIGYYVDRPVRVHRNRGGSPFDAHAVLGGSVTAIASTTLPATCASGTQMHMHRARVRVSGRSAARISRALRQTSGHCRSDPSVSRAPPSGGAAPPATPSGRDLRLGLRPDRASPHTKFLTVCARHGALRSGPSGAFAGGGRPAGSDRLARACCPIFGDAVARRGEETKDHFELREWSGVRMVHAQVPVKAVEEDDPR
jgi:hypothetical protein